MLTAYRLVKRHHAANALDGRGASLHGGRWNSPGTHMVYACATRALAALEILVHIDPTIPVRWVMVSFQLPGELVMDLELDRLPPDWQQEPPGASTQEVGDVWARGRESLALRVPSAVIPREANILVNPRHPLFVELGEAVVEEFAFDPRLLRA